MKEVRISIWALVWELGLQDLIEPSSIKNVKIEYQEYEEGELVIEYENSPDESLGRDETAFGGREESQNEKGGMI